jgi:Zn finger protein HypA/HybF involved in hydrogenase expression
LEFAGVRTVSSTETTKAGLKSTHKTGCGIGGSAKNAKKSDWMATKKEKQWMDRVAQLPCATCGSHGVQLHHIREGQGMAQRASNFLVIPLCPDCHTGSMGVHGDKTMMRLMKVTELDLLARTIEALQ